MSDEPKILDGMPKAAPTEEELRAWAALPEAERVRRFEAALLEGFEGAAVKLDYETFVRRARARNLANPDS